MRFTMILWMIGATLSCSQGGGQDSPPPSAPPAELEPPPPSQLVSVDFIELLSLSDLGEGCGHPLRDSGISTAVFPKIDGEFSDWLGNAKSWFDPSGDADEGMDLESFSIKKSKNDLFFKVVLQGGPQESTFVYLEFIGAAIVEQELLIERRKLIRIQAGKGWILEKGQWQELPIPFAMDAQWSPSGVEARLSKDFLLAGTIMSPLWGVRLSVGSETRWHDFSGQVLFLGDEGNGYGFFDITGCGRNKHAKFSVDSQEVKIAGDESDEAFALVRAAQDHVSRIFRAKESYTFPIGSIPVIVTGVSQTYKELDDYFLGTRGSKTVPMVFMFERTGERELGIVGAKNYRISEYTHKNGLTEISSRYLDILLFGSWMRAPAELRDAVKAGIMSSLTRESLGTPYWLNWVYDSDRSEDARYGIVMEYLLSKLLRKLIEDGRIEDVNKDHDQDTIPYYAAIRLLDTWVSQTGVGKTSREFWRDASTGIDNEKLNEAMKFDRGDDRNAWVSTQLADIDGDGLPLMIEDEERLRGDASDSDEDGWSDYAEIVLGTSAENPMNRPSFVVPDGSYGDFLDLLPGKIFPELEEDLSDCPPFTDIVSYVGLVDQHKIMAGARFRKPFDPEEGRPVRWEISIEFAEKGVQTTVVLTAGQRGYSLLDKNGNVITEYPTPYQNGIIGIDQIVRLSSLGLDMPGEDVRMKISSFIDDETNFFCDDTPWFSPWISEL